MVTTQLHALLVGCRGVRKYRFAEWLRTIGAIQTIPDLKPLVDDCLSAVRARAAQARLASMPAAMDREMFAANVAALVPEYRCITLDQRGFGKTGPATAPFSYWDSARDLLVLLDHLGIERATLAGMSQGGFIALRAALLAPERETALVLIATRSGTDLPETIAAFRGLDAEWRSNGSQNVKPDVGHLLGIAHAPDPWFAKWDCIGRDDLHYPISALAARDDVTARLGEITAPALVIHGESDVAIAFEHGAALCDALPNSVPIVAVPGAGHAPNMQFPDAVNAALLKFLSGLDTDFRVNLSS